MLNTGHRYKNIKRINMQNEEPNPKVLSLDKVVQEIDSKVLAYYLKQVSIFLKNNKKDLWFPKLTPYLDAFLVRVIRDVQNIENLLNTFDSKSRVFAVDIINSLKQNADVYTLTYTYDNNRMDTDILVYRKVYKEKELIAAAIEANSAPDKHIDGLNLDWVKATLKFMQDDTWTHIEYPPMDYAEADLVYSVIRQRCEDVTKLGPLCVTLVKAIEILKRTTDLKTSFLYVANDKVKLSLEKKPVNNNNKEKKSDLNKSNTSDNSDSKPQNKVKKAFLKRKELIDTLDKAFINTTLKMILNFISTEEEASLVFKNANEDQCMFIQTACSMAKTPKFYCLFAYDSRDILKNISKTLASNQWYELRIDVAKVQKDNKLRTVSLIKHPKEEKKSVPKSGSQTNSANSTFSGRSKSLDRKNVVKKSVMFESAGKLEQVVGGILEVNKENTDVKAKNPTNYIDTTTDNSENTYGDNDQTDTATPSTTYSNKEKNATNNKVQTRLSRVDNKDQTTSNNIKRAKSVPPQIEHKDETTDKNKDTYESLDDKRLCLSKLKSLKAMSIPMESDIAMRMMRQMGWQGGPLGLRGEGITEPIIPALHLAPKAGLGHEADKVISGFRLHFLEQVLGLITKSQNKIIIEFKTTITPCENRYVTSTIKSFNDRKKVMEKVEKIKQVLIKIMEELNCEPDLNLLCGVSSDKKYLTLTKEIVPLKRKIILGTDDRDATVMQKCINLPKIITIDDVKSIGSLYFKKSVQAAKLGLRIIAKYKVMEFMKSDNIEDTIEFNYTLPKKGINVIQSIVQLINSRGKVLDHISIEGEFHVESLRHARGKQIEIMCINKQKFTLRKILLQQNPPNTKREIIDVDNNNSNIIDKNKEIAVSDVTRHDKTNDNVVDTTNVTDNIKNVTDNNIETATDKEEIIVIESDEETKDESIEIQDVESANNLSICSKRNRSDSACSNNIMKKNKITDPVIYLYLTKDCEQINNEDVIEFQTALIEQVDLAINLPTIECLGVENGAIIYGCYNDIGASLVKSVASQMNLTTKSSEKFDERSNKKLKIRLNSYVGVNLMKLFNLIECYNVGLTTDNWTVEDVEIFKGYIVILVQVDFASFEYIMEANFRLFAGMDRLRISIDWE